MAYIFYDTETTGVETAFDQILQFAAVKTDDEFNEMETVNLRTRLLPHVVPSPGALMVTDVSPGMLVDAAYPTHYEAIREIRRILLRWSPAIVCGYNSIAFDEELLRQALFQTLHSAYLTNTKGNVRGDIMKAAIAASIYAPGALCIPLNEKERPSFKLGDLARANGFGDFDAHDALADVRATIFIAKLLRERAPDVWFAMERACRKSAIIDYIWSNDAFSYSDRFFGRSYSCDLPPLKWSSLKYYFWMEDEIDGKEKAYG